MTSEHIDRLVTYNIHLASLHKQAVLDAVRNLGNPLPKEIKKFLDEQVRNEVILNYYEQGHINKKELENKIKQRNLSMRTILRKLAELTKERLLEHENNRYSVSKRAESDIRYFARQFGLEALAQVMDAHYPELFPLEKNLDELIKIFGIYIVFCFIEAARPTYSDGSSITTNLEKDRLADSWIKNVFRPWNMYNSFFAAITCQLEDNAVQKYVDQYSKIGGFEDDNNYANFTKSKIGEDENGHFVISNSDEKIYEPHSSTYFATKRFHLLTSRISEGTPQYELDGKTIKRLTEIIKQKYPLYYERLFEVRAGFLGKPKERSRRDRREVITHFDRETEE